jgi:cell wall-associated NlpC family hydrolase
MLAVALLCLLAGGCGGGAGGSTATRTASSAAHADSLPPLPATMRPKVVQPSVGNDGGSTSSVTTADPGLNDAGPAPTGAASAGARRTAGDTSAPVAIDQATALPNGVAVPPLEAPDEVKQIIQAGNVIARSPYIWGGGHGKWIDKGYDCSGSVSFALAAAGLLNGPLDSGHLAHWGQAGPGRWVTIYANATHVFMEVAGIRFDTSGQRVTGSRWQNEMRPTAGFAVRHPPGL